MRQEPLVQGQQTSYKGKDGQFFAFADHTVTVATTQFHNHSKKAAQTTHQ